MKSQDAPDTCATIIQNSPNHIATLPTGHISSIEVPITNEKPKIYQINDNNFLLHNVAQTYHQNFTEPMPQTNYAPQYTEETPSLPSFSFHQVYMTDPMTKTTKSSLYNEQPISHTTKPRFFLQFLILRKMSNLPTKLTFSFLI